jgi:phosphatidate cytidylyltransferase
MLGARLVAIALWAPVHLVVLIWGRPYHWLIYLEIIAVLATLELFEVQTTAGRRPHRLVTLVCGGVFLGAAAYKPALAAAAAAAAVVGNLFLVVTRRTPAGSLADAAAGVLAFAYIPALLAFLMLTRKLEGGVQLLLVFFVSIWLIDIFAYTVGRLWGKRPLAPAFSPAKTLEGGVAGVVAGIIAAPLLAVYAFPGSGLGWAGGLLTGIALTAGDLVGDLAESAFKRDAGVKDAGSLLPGHGGVLDRFDSVLFCAPLFYGVALAARAWR